MPTAVSPARRGSEVPFRRVAYAEDHLLAQDMLRAGYAKVYVPDAAVVHSHEYSTWQWLRRSFDEARAMREVYGWAPGRTRRARNLRGNVTGDWRWARRRAAMPSGTAERAPGWSGRCCTTAPEPPAALLGAPRRPSARRLVVARLSLEGRV